MKCAGTVTFILLMALGNFVRKYPFLKNRHFSHFLTMPAQLGTQILPKKEKRRYKLCKINVYGFVLN